MLKNNYIFKRLSHQHNSKCRKFINRKFINRKFITGVIELSYTDIHY